jgi:hypothetical protein
VIAKVIALGYVKVNEKATESEMLMALSTC